VERGEDEQLLRKGKNERGGRKVSSTLYGKKVE